jgi:hypothetical protein
MTNREAIGYMLLACKELNLDKEIVIQIRSSMYRQFDMKTESEAEEQGHKYFYEEVDND